MTSENVDIPVLAGDAHDDDGQVLDSIVQPANPPTIEQLPVATIDTPKRTPRPLTRTITSTQTVLPSFGPVQVLPADADRESLSITVRTPEGVTTTYARLADDSSKVGSDMGAFVLIPNQNNVGVLAGHTGPVWVAAVDTGAADAAVTVSVVAVTE